MTEDEREVEIEGCKSLVQWASAQEGTVRACITDLVDAVLRDARTRIAFCKTAKAMRAEESIKILEVRRNKYTRVKERSILALADLGVAHGAWKLTRDVTWRSPSGTVVGFKAGTWLWEDGDDSSQLLNGKFEYVEEGK